MKVLFTLLHAGGLAHLNPLIALDSLCKRAGIKTAFLVPKFRHSLLKNYGLDVVSIDHKDAANNGFRTEMQAYGKFRPDVVIDDASLTTYFATKVCNIPRIAIHRTGIFPGTTPKIKTHNHSMGNFDMNTMPDVRYLGIEQPESFENLFDAAAKIVPGVKSVEKLPENIESDDSYFYSGPLIIEDFLADPGETEISFTSVSKEKKDIDNFKDFSDLENFFHQQKDRKVIYLTYGTIAVGDAPEVIFEVVKWLLDNDYAVISSVPIQNLSDEQNSRYFFSRYFPMHYVCERVDLMVHHCGSGTYHYPIIHKVPTITIGTECYDREDVAYRLQELGASIHLSGPNEDSSFFTTFKNSISRYFDDGDFKEKQQNVLNDLGQEIKETQRTFDIKKVINFALNANQI